MPPRSAMHDTFVIERHYDAAPAKIFAFFADTAKKRRWFGAEDEGFEIESFEPDFRVDHIERWTFRFKGGELITNDTRYQDIVPNERVVFVYTMDFGAKRVSSSQTTIQLIANGRGTTLIHTEQGVFFDGVDQAAGRQEGTRGLLDRLEHELALDA